MSTNLKTYDSTGGFSVGKTTIVNELKDVKNINSLEIKNSQFSDSSRTAYILRGLNSSVLGVDSIGTQINLPSSTINFITAHIIATNPSGSGLYSLKIESTVSCNSVGDVVNLSDLTTIIKDTIPEGQTWTVSPFDSGFANKFSYSVTRAGTTDVIKWLASVEVVSISWQ